MYGFEDYDAVEVCDAGLEGCEAARQRRLKLERHADQIVGPELSMWRGSKIEDTGPAEGEPDDSKRHRPIAIFTSDPCVPDDEEAEESSGNSRIETADFKNDLSEGYFNFDDVDMWIWFVLDAAWMTPTEDDEEKKFYLERDLLMMQKVQGPESEQQIRDRNLLIMSHIAAGVPAVGIDDGFVAPPDHDPAPICASGFFTVSLKQRQKECAREQGEKLKVFRPQRRFNRARPKLAEPRRVKAALMKLRVSA